MAEYDIKRWDGVMFGNSITKMPMIYIEPDLKFLQFVEANNYAVVCNITGTGMIYDDVSIPGVVDRSCSIPNCRPNFYEETGYYVITLMGTWNGYPHPDKLGKVVFSGLNAPEEEVDVILIETDDEGYIVSNNKNRVDRKRSTQNMNTVEKIRDFYCKNKLWIALFVFGIIIMFIPWQNENISYIGLAGVFFGFFGLIGIWDILISTWS